jgi:hypothetical protein
MQIRSITIALVLASYATAAAQESKYVGMPKLVLEQLCEKNDPGCRYFIGGVADALYYAAKGTICFPMKDTNGIRSIDLERVVETAKGAMPPMAFDQDMAAGLFLVWKAAYPCQK